jgi:hypothetical protein
VWTGVLSSWITVSLFRYNIWIMTCFWSPNLIMCSLTVIRPWRVIIGQAEYCTTILLPKPRHNPPVFHCWKQAFLECSQNVISSWSREHH